MARLEDVLLIDVRGSQPAANAVPAGTLFAVSDESFLIEQSDGASWAQYGPTPGGGANSVTAAGTLTASRLVLGAGVKTVAEAASLGTTTTVLHGNAAGAPTFGAVSLTADVSGVLPVANGGTGTSNANVVPILRATKVLTNAEVIALPTTPISVLAAPGAGFYYNIVHVELLSKFTTAAYTGVNTTYAVIAVSINGSSYTFNLGNDNATAPQITALTAFMGNTARRVRLLQYMEAIGTAAGSDELYVTGWTANGTTLGLDTTANLENQAILIAADNNGSGNYGGGNAANTLTVKVLYTIEAMP